MKTPFRLYPFALAVAVAGCGSATVCGEHTTARFNSTTGETECVSTATVTPAPQCDPATSKLVGGECVGDPSKFPTCGPGTMFDMNSKQCLPVGSGQPQPKPCDATQAPGKFCVDGVIRFLKDEGFTTGTMLEVRGYDPLQFLADPKTPPQAVTTTSDASFALNGLSDTNGMGLIALAVTDAGGPTNYILAGIGTNNVMPGGKYRLDLYAIEKSTVAKWDMTAGLTGAMTFESTGAYVARYFDKPIALEDSAHRVAGAVITADAMKVPSINCATSGPCQFFFKGDMVTLDPALMATDAVTGTAVERVAPQFPHNYSGQAPGLMFETILGASLPGVVFIQKFHSKM